MKILRKPILFAVGGTGYVLLEFLWRGWSHISMFLAGGLCFLLLGRLRSRPISMPAKLGAGAGTITAVELATGLLVNRNFAVWDYRGQPGNFLGQICPIFTALWVPIGAAGMALYGWAEAGLDRLSGHQSI